MGGERGDAGGMELQAGEGSGQSLGVQGVGNGGGRRVPTRVGDGRGGPGGGAKVALGVEGVGGP